jgi:hypothetical protein
VFGGDRDHFLRPRIADLAGDDLEFRKFQRDFIDVGNRPAGFGWPQRTGVADLRAKGNSEFDALGIERRGKNRAVAPPLPLPASGAR